MVTMKKSLWCVGETKKHFQMSSHVTGGKRSFVMGLRYSLAAAIVTKVVTAMTGM